MRVVPIREECRHAGRSLANSNDERPLTCGWRMQPSQWQVGGQRYAAWYRSSLEPSKALEILLHAGGPLRSRLVLQKRREAFALNLSDLDADDLIP
jgi:hypothetical protein